MVIVLAPGEMIRVELQDSDGAFEVEFGRDKLTVWADMPGSVKGEAGVIYEECWSGSEFVDKDSGVWPLVETPR